VSTTDQQTAEELDARYGRRTQSRRNRVIFVSAVVAVAAVLVAWVAWGGLDSPDAEISADATGYVLIDDHAVDVRFQLSVAPGTEVKCAVQALNEGFSVIGWKIIDVPASAERIRKLSSTVRTTELAVTGLIHRCWTP
jgi:hypothetical protein